MLRGGAIVPHAPLVAMAQGEAATVLHKAAAETWASIAALGCPVVVVSAHGSATGVSSRGDGGLDGFGPLGVQGAAEVDADLAAELARAWSHPFLDVPLDHGAVGALALADTLPPVVVCSFAETTGPSPRASVTDVARAARSLGDALLAEAERRDLAVVVSAHSSAGLTPAAPLTELPEGKAFDDALLDALATDNAALAEISLRSFEVNGTCSTGPLLVWSHLFAGRVTDVHAYDAPHGVGYLVASCL